MAARDCQLVSLTAGDSIERGEGAQKRAEKEATSDNRESYSGRCAEKEIRRPAAQKAVSRSAGHAEMSS